jgi:lipid A 3-O-deacylase PagL
MKSISLLALLLCQSPTGDSRTQYPALLRDSFIAAEVGAIDYPFSDRVLEAGFHAQSIGTPRPAVRVVVFGHELNSHVSLQASYMRPVRYVTYTNINGDAAGHHVWTHFGGLTVRGKVPIGGRTALFGETGLGITSRHGFDQSDTPVVRDAHYASLLAGGGIEHALSRSSSLTAGVTYVPGNARYVEPRAVFVSGGFRYTLRALPQERADANAHSGFVFPRNVLQVEISTGYGYGINHFVARTVPVFWYGNVLTDRGVAVHYQRNVFHTAKIFGLDLGTSASTWRSRGSHERFGTLSIYPLFRFTFLRTRDADFYACYSLAGPTYISKVIIDGRDTGHHFTFQDFMGAGAFLGRARRLSFGVKINHYSNGNIFTENAGLRIPLTFTAGLTF